jgi:phage/plasmid-associated DNA primase
MIKKKQANKISHVIEWCNIKGENLEAVLAWMIDGASLWYQREGKGLETPQEVKDLTNQQRTAQDSVGLWIEECCEIKEDEWTETTKVRYSYENWCEANGYEPKKAKGLNQSLTAHGCEVSVAKWVTGDDLKGRSLRGVKNLKII